MLSLKDKILNCSNTLMKYIKDLSPNGERKKTPTVLQMEAVECGAAALGMILAYHGRILPLEELRVECGVSRDGSKASNMMKAARKYGLIARGYTKEPEELRLIPLPAIIFWNFNHFVVLEGFKKDRVYLNDPASGPRVISWEEFDLSFTGITLIFEPGPEFVKGGEKRSWLRSLQNRVAGNSMALTYVVLAGLFLVIPGLVIPIFSKIFVDSILVGKMTGWLKPLLLAMAITAGFRAFLTWLQEYYLLRFETKLALTSSAKFFRHVFRLPVEFFTQRMAGDIGVRVQLNDKVAQLLSGELATNMLNIVMIVFYAFLMFWYDIVMTLVGVAIAALNIVLLKYISQKRVVLNQQLQQDTGKLMGMSMCGLMMIETLKASGSESDFFSQWSGHQAKVVNSMQKMAIPNQFLTVMPTLLLGLNNVAILTLGAFRVMDGYMSMGMLVAFQSLMASFIHPVNQMVNLGGKLQETKADMNRLDDVFKHQLDNRFLRDGRPEEAAAPEKVKLSGELELVDITFGYSRLEPPLIVDFNLKLKPGARVALVGGSGSGKSTVAKLVAGLYEPWSGKIFFDGKPLEEIPRDLLNNSVAMVDQDLFMFSGTIRDNLSMWDNTISENRINQAAKDACIHEGIAFRAGGYSSDVEEGGGNFSGGQLQRLEIARSLVNNPTILIMDEATSALDPTTENIVDDNLRRRGCTCLIIAHRLSTIRDCDEIIVLDRGKVVQRGTHEEMIKVEGKYADLIKAS